VTPRVYEEIGMDKEHFKANKVYVTIISGCETTPHVIMPGELCIRVGQALFCNVDIVELFPTTELAERVERSLKVRLLEAQGEAPPEMK